MTKTPTIPSLRRGQREFRVDDPELQPAYKVAHAHATENGRNYLRYRDFYVGHFDEDVAPCTHAQMRAARRHFRVARGLPEGPDPAMERKFVRRLADQGLLITRHVRTGIAGAERLEITRIPKRYRKI